MLVKWMLAFGLQGTALITIAPVRSRHCSRQPNANRQPQS